MRNLEAHPFRPSSFQVHVLTQQPLQAGSVLDEELIEVAIAAQDLEAWRSNMDAAALFPSMLPQELQCRALREQEVHEGIGDDDPI